MSGLRHALVGLTHGPQTFEHEDEPEHEHDFRNHPLAGKLLSMGKTAEGSSQ